MRYLCLLQQQPESNNRPRQTRRNINRNREDEHSRLMNNYFSENSTHMENALSNRYPYFQIRFDAFGRNGLSSLQKCTAKIHILAYGSPGYIVDGYVRISKSTTVECLKSFVKGVNEIFGNNYLRRPNNNNINRLLQIGETHGFSFIFNMSRSGKKGCGERTFGAFKSHFIIICGPLGNWQMGTMKNIILAYIILHNMIVEDERDTYNGNVDVDYDHIDNEISNIDLSCGAHPDFATYLQTKTLYA
ncbi:hypothetical protein JHK82_025104 [Glycine max]|nr:hypothetical protein JHK82_025104 [Glycine max]